MSKPILEIKNLHAGVEDKQILKGVSLTIGRRLVSTLIRWANDNLVSEVPVISMILVLMLGMALTTQLIGVHTVLGAFVAGGRTGR